MLTLHVVGEYKIYQTVKLNRNNFKCNIMLENAFS